MAYGLERPCRGVQLHFTSTLPALVMASATAAAAGMAATAASVTAAATGCAVGTAAVTAVAAAVASRTPRLGDGLPHVELRTGIAAAPVTGRA